MPRPSHLTLAVPVVSDVTTADDAPCNAPILLPAVIVSANSPDDEIAALSRLSLSATDQNTETEEQVPFNSVNPVTGQNLVKDVPAVEEVSTVHSHSREELSLQLDVHQDLLDSAPVCQLLGQADGSIVSTEPINNISG
jgi:hypothetical protein